MDDVRCSAWRNKLSWAMFSLFIGQDRRSAPQCLGDCRPLINLKKNLKFEKGNSNKLTSQMQQFYKFITWRFVSHNMFRAPPRPPLGAYNCINSLWFLPWGVVAAVLLVVVWPVITGQTTTNLLDVLCRTTCFGRLHAHHQELTTALTASGFYLGAWW